MAETIQYRVVEVKGERKSGGAPADVTPEQLQAELSRHAKEGWELFSTHERTTVLIDTVESMGHTTQARTTFILSVILIFKKG